MKPYKIPEMAKKYVDNEMIQTYTELPEFPETRIRLLFTFLANQRIPLLHSELYSLVASLVQLAMDTHDMIDSDSGHVSEREMRSRQLKVLAGDYFSSRFYQLLSEAGQVDMIKSISEGVCEVNKLKVNFYMRMKQFKMSAEEYLIQYIQIKTELFQSFTSILDEQVVRVWQDLLSGVGQCEVVLEELTRSEKPEQFSGSWAYWHVLGEGTEEERRSLMDKPDEYANVPSLLIKYDIRSQLTEKLKQSVAHVKAVVSRLESDKLVQELLQIGETFVRPLIPAASVLNERR